MSVTQTDFFPMTVFFFFRHHYFSMWSVIWTDVNLQTHNVKTFIVSQQFLFLLFVRKLEHFSVPALLRAASTWEALDMLQATVRIPNSETEPSEQHCCWSPTCSRERGLSGALTPDPTSRSWDGDRGQWGVVVELEGKAGMGKGGGGWENGLSTGAWEAEEYEGVLPPSTAARWTADDFLFFQTLCRLGEEEEDEEDELGRSAGGRGKRRKA